MAKKRIKIREFRTSISKLKKAGLISKSVDARKVKPTRHYKKVLRQYRGVLEGRQRVVNVTKKQASVAADSGLNVRGKNVIIDHTPGARVIKSKKDPFGYRIKFPNNVQEVELPGPKGQTIDEYFDNLESVAPRRGRVAFTINGHQSKAVFSSIDLARAYFLKYPSTESILSNGDSDEEEELIALTTFYWLPDTRTVWKGKVAPKPRTRKVSRSVSKKKPTKRRKK